MSQANRRNSAEGAKSSSARSQGSQPRDFFAKASVLWRKPHSFSISSKCTGRL